jgi:hypothetical protein
MIISGQAEAPLANLDAAEQLLQAMPNGTDKLIARVHRLRGRRCWPRRPSGPWCPWS